MMYGSGESLSKNGIDKPLGFISQKYESGTIGVEAIADVPGDGGGKAYGIFQLDSRFKHLKRYIMHSEYKYVFGDVPIGSEKFDEIWRSIANTDGYNFEHSQRRYVTKAYYDPAIRYASISGYDVKSRAVREAIFSIAVQHGGYKTILKKARMLMTMGDEESQIIGLYMARRIYVQGLKTISKKVLHALLKRYELEEEDVKTLLVDYSSPHIFEVDEQTSDLSLAPEQSKENSTQQTP